jgi:hypothetical protein
MLSGEAYMKIVAAGNKKLAGDGCMATSCLEKVKKLPGLCSLFVLILGGFFYPAKSLIVNC